MRWIAGALVLLASSALVVAGASGQATKRQRIAIEENGDRSGTFKLIPLTPGPVKADSGAWTFAGATQSSSVIRNGQALTRFKGADQFKGRNGTFRIPTVSLVMDAGGGFAAGTQTWSLRNGTGAYAGVRGGGAGVFVSTPRGGGSDRFEGYVTVP
jgi:hypothetical protein